MFLVRVLLSTEVSRVYKRASARLSVEVELGEGLELTEDGLVVPGFGLEFDVWGVQSPRLGELGVAAVGPRVMLVLL